MSRDTLARLLGPALLVVVVWASAVSLPPAFDPLDDELVAVQDERSQLLAELATARDTPTRLDELDGVRAVADTAVPATADVAAFVRSVSDLGDRSGVAVEQIAPLTVAGADTPDAAVVLPSGTSSITVSVGATGSYEQAMDFVAGLEGLDRLVVTDLIGLTADEEDASLVILDLELRIFTTADLVVTAELDEDELYDAAVAAGGDEGPVDGGGAVESDEGAAPPGEGS